MNKFEKDLQEARVGEVLVADFLQQQDWYVEDVSGKEEYYPLGIDIIAYNFDEDRSLYIDVKFDGVMANTGNFFIETMSNKETGKLGWWVTSHAETYFYVDKHSLVAYVFHKKDMEKFLQNNYCKVIQTNADYGGKTTVGKLVPWEKFGMEFPMGIYNLKGGKDDE